MEAMENYLLVRRPHPCHQESLYGYLLRLCEVNGLETYRNVMCRAGMRHRSNYSGFDITNLSDITGHEKSELGKLSYPIYRKTEAKREEDREHVSAQQLDVRFPKVCVLCVKEKGYIESIWDLKLYCGCAEHGIWATQSCSTCGKKMNWARPGMLECSCGAKFRSEKSRKMNSPEVALLSLIRSRYLGIQNYADTCGMPIKMLSDLSLNALLRLIWVFGRTGKDTRCSSVLAENTIRQAALALSDWPNGFHSYLGKIESEEIIRFSSGRINALRKIVDRKMHTSGAEKGKAAFFYDAVVAFFAQKRESAVPDGSLLSADLSKNDIRYLHRSKLWHQSEFVPYAEASRILGIKKSVLIELIQNGWLSRTKIIRDTQSVMLADCREFMKNLGAFNPANQGMCSRNNTYKNLVHNARNSPKEKAALLNLVRSKKVRAYGSMNGAISGLLLSADDVRSELRNIKAYELGGMSVSVVSAVLKRPAGDILKMVDAGLLRITRKGMQRLIDRQSVEDLKCNYITTGVAGKMLCGSGRMVTEWCLETGIPIITIKYHPNRPEIGFFRLEHLGEIPYFGLLHREEVSAVYDAARELKHKTMMLPGTPTIRALIQNQYIEGIRYGEGWIVEREKIVAHDREFVSLHALSQILLKTLAELRTICSKEGVEVLVANPEESKSFTGTMMLVRRTEVEKLISRHVHAA